MSSLTPAQEAAAQASGNVLVEAGAGTGKTRTLVERCLRRLSQPEAPVPLKDMVIVTFTEAAAAEMRQRIRDALIRQCRLHPDNDWFAEQLAAVDTAWISTLHSFCLSLAREHFHEVGLDPQFVVLPAEQSAVLEQESLNTVFRHPEHAARLPRLCRWSGRRGRGGMRGLREQVRRLSHYAHSLREPDAWLETELAHLSHPTPVKWLELWPREYAAWRAHWRESLEPWREEGFGKCLTALAEGSATGEWANLRSELESLLAQLPPAKGLPKAAQKARETLTEEVEFLLSLRDPAKASPPAQGGPDSAPATAADALTEDWEWTRHALADLVHLTRAFLREYARRKEELGGVDFPDLEQIALRLLWDPRQRAPTPIAERWRQRTQLLLIDEYQDINEAQDAILQCLARAEGNRFLVGDIKQSIYRFRLANPRIFRDYAQRWRDPSAGARVVRLSENFRSHPALLGFVNGFFEGLMREATGGVDYGAETALQAGAPDHRRFREEPTPDGGRPPRVELRLWVAEEASGEEEDGAEDALAELSNHEAEARLIGARLQEWRREGRRVWDEARQDWRPMDWRDMAILLRSPRDKAEVFAKEFDRLGIPLTAARGGFYDALEVMDWLNLLRLLDNPLQDLPLLAVLRSPLGNFTAGDLATIRLADRRGLFWTALARYAETGSVGPTRERAAAFLERHRTWRHWARVTALSECLSLILDETLYETWLVTQSRAEQRLANLRRLLGLTRQFDQFQRQGLFRFLRFVEQQIEAGVDAEPAAADGAEAVRLLSIHHSKGLEFPVVVVADLAKTFNETDLRGPLILDERWGLCPEVAPPFSGQRYPSLAHWIARRRQRLELIGEEMRLLYVAITRARDYLLLTGRASVKRLATWAAQGEHTLTGVQIAQARAFLDWVGPRCARLAPAGDLASGGVAGDFAWGVNDPAPPRAATPAGAAEPTVPGEAASLSEDDLAQARQYLAWEYPRAEATRQPAKTSVSAWRRRVVEETDAEAYPLFSEREDSSTPAPEGGRHPAATRLSATEIGTAHHAFLENVGLDRTDSREAIEAEAERMEREGVLSPEERAALDTGALAAFWAGELGRQVLAERTRIRRELPFTARFGTAELRAWFGLESPPGEARDEGEFIVVQGVVDLAVIRERDLWVVDYKTDHVDPEGVAKKVHAYAPQLALYATALGRIYQRPATQCWLHFLALDRSVPVPLPAGA